MSVTDPAYLDRTFSRDDDSAEALPGECWQVTAEGRLPCAHLDAFCKLDPDHHHTEDCPEGY